MRLDTSYQTIPPDNLAWSAIIQRLIPHFLGMMLLLEGLFVNVLLLKNVV